MSEKQPNIPPEKPQKKSKSPLVGLIILALFFIFLVPVSSFDMPNVFEGYSNGPVFVHLSGSMSLSCEYLGMGVISVDTGYNNLPNGNSISSGTYWSSSCSWADLELGAGP